MKKKSLCFAVSLALVGPFALAASPCEPYRQATTAAPLPQNLQPLMAQNLLDFQRQLAPLYALPMAQLAQQLPQIERLESQALTYTEKLIRRYGWIGATRGGEDVAAAVFQFSQMHPTLGPCVPELMKTQLDTQGDRNRYATLIDRLHFQKGEPLEYGMFHRVVMGRVIFPEVRDPATTDAQRQQLGLGTYANHQKAVLAQHPVKPPVGLARPVKLPAECKTLTTEKALNRALSVQDIASLEQKTEALVAADQGVRTGTLSGKTMGEVDQASGAFVREVLKTQGWPSANRASEYLSYHFWLLTQHQDHDPALRACILPLIQQQMSLTSEKRNFAYLTDRVLLAEGKPQLYGTQVAYDAQSDRYSVRTLQDPQNVNKRRANMGLEPLEAYLKTISRP